MNILIIEDEYPASERLKTLLGRIDIKNEVVGVLESVSMACAWLQAHEPPDLILSDIQLSDGISFEIFEKNLVKSPLIFTTAFDEYAIKAFKLNSIDYLVKPIRQDELAFALKKYQRHQGSQAATLKQSQLLDIIKSLNPSVKEYKERFLVHGKDEWIPVFTTEVAYFTSSHELTHLVCFDGKRFVVDHTLAELEDQLNPNSFFRANRQYIIQVTSIHRVYPYFNGRLMLSLRPASKDDVIISKSKASAFKHWFSQDV